MWPLKSEWELSLESENNNKYPLLLVASCCIGLPLNRCQCAAQVAEDMLVVNVSANHGYVNICMYNTYHINISIMCHIIHITCLLHLNMRGDFYIYFLPFCGDQNSTKTGVFSHFGISGVFFLCFLSEVT